jgi:hypothetical protein
MILINKERLLGLVEVKVMSIGLVNGIVGVALFAFQFSMLNNIHNPLSGLYQGPEQIGLRDIWLPLFMASLTYFICHRFAEKALVDQGPTAKLLSYSFLPLSFYCCFFLYAVVCLIADSETSLSAQTCYVGLLMTSLFNALIPIGEILWTLTLGKSKFNSAEMVACNTYEKARLLFIMLPLFLILFAIPWLTLPHMILLVVPSVI